MNDPNDTFSVDGAFDIIESRVYAALRAEGEDARQRLVEMTSVPVQIVPGPRGGKRIVRSAPGEPPRLETGDLNAGFDSRVTADSKAGLVTLTVENPVEYSGFLENGTQNVAPRPHWQRVLDDWDVNLAGRVAAEIARS